MGKTRILLLTLFFVVCSSCSRGNKRLPQILGESATPQFGYVLTLPRINDCVPAGTERSGKVVLYEFFLSSCSHCRSMEPAIRELAAEYHERGLVVFSISTEEWQKARVLVQPSSARSLCSDQELFFEWELEGVPYFILTDRRGSVRYMVLGGGTGTQMRLEEYIEELIEE
jgi:thiol-disulfide isomerase/thioredoxin